MSLAEAESVTSRANDQAVWPWQTEPYRLWSLLDMLVQFNARDFGSFLTNFERACAYTEMILAPPPAGESRDTLLRSAVPHYRQALLGLMSICLEGKIVLSQSVALQVARLEHKLANDVNIDHPLLAAEARVTRQLLMDDLAQHVFVSIPNHHRKLFEQPEPVFGAEVDQRFGDARRDIEAAGRCLALSEWTACVFHCMRVLEHGLRPMAARFGVAFTTDSWHAVIRGIEDGIAALRNKRGLTEQDHKEISHYSEAASQFRYFKDAWRNHVTHAREHYDERDAEAVLTHVRTFMQHMATNA